jgi:hypothetical protein
LCRGPNENQKSYHSPWRTLSHTSLIIVT